MPCTAVTERRWSLLPAAAASSPPTQPGPPLRRSRRRRRHLLLLSPPPPRSLPISRSVPFPPCPRLSPPRRRRPWQSRHGTAGGSRCNTMTGIAAASFFSNACRFGGCGLHFPTLAELIEHIEDNHIGERPGQGRAGHGRVCGGTRCSGSRGAAAATAAGSGRARSGPAGRRGGRPGEAAARWVWARAARWAQRGELVSVGSAETRRRRRRGRRTGAARRLLLPPRLWLSGLRGGREPPRRQPFRFLLLPPPRCVLSALLLGVAEHGSPAAARPRGRRRGGRLRAGGGRGTAELPGPSRDSVPSARRSPSRHL